MRTGAAEPRGSTLELELYGPDPAPSELEGLRQALAAAGAARVERTLLTAPESDQRVAELVEVATLIVGGVGNVVAIVETVRQWMAQRHAAATNRVAASAAEEAVPRVRVTLGEDTLELVHPSDRATDEAIARFYDRHRTANGPSGGPSS
ncbi:hypothetical protein [Streptomyces sp. VRA16 Mangrove soil]|uniref:hypothetical protein n=1 Tax=Streptomyces sp. VRA16 Mangrove soil TaxID=2817434 RepID=UPI001A9EB52C|nr:hypothetical protein [Streptomyces sp. VRA16 Mangrove soil]MBO1334969.1 hypothetical protein [Streptomyces sp. VRA16 Mangrove soil]